MPEVKEPKKRLAVLLVKVLVGTLLLFVLINAGMLLLYRSRSLPNYYLGRYNAGGQSASSLQSTPSAAILPSNLILYGGRRQVRETPAALGISVDVPASVATLQKIHRYLPVLALMPHHSPLNLRVDQTRFHTEETHLAAVFGNPAEGRHIVYNNGTFNIAAGRTGYRLDGQALLSAALAAIQAGSSTFNVPTVAIPTPADDSHLAQDLHSLQRRLGSKIGFVYQGHTIQPGKEVIGSWFRADGVSMAASPGAVQPYLAGEVARQFNVTIANPSDLATAAAYAVNAGDSASFNVATASGGTVIRTYCTAVDEENPSALDELTGKLAETYNDARGWNDNGRIVFEHVASGCQYTVWLAAPSQMTTFGAICDDYYNCQVGTSVILNYDRWSSATPPWEQTGGSLNDYHTLMIDHETGHRLGFADNPVCPGAGQPAPVMMQQSIDLKGCVFNIWPTPPEFTRLDQMLNLPVTTQSRSE